MVVRRSAFTLIEVLISIALLSLVLLALYSSMDMLRNSNKQLSEYLNKATKEKRATETLFLDILGSDGNITIVNNEFSRLCIDSSANSLYGLPSAKVCWVVAKPDKRLLRSEGNGYKLPIGDDDRVEVDEAMRDIELFRIYRQKSEALVILKQKGKKSISFLVHGVPEIIKATPKKPAKTKRKSSPKTPLKKSTSPFSPIPPLTPNNQIK